MSLFDLSNKIEEQHTQLIFALAVLREAREYLERKIEPDSTEAYCLIRQTERIHLLLGAADELACRVLPELNDTAGELIALHKNAKA